MRESMGWRRAEVRALADDAHGLAIEGRPLWGIMAIASEAHHWRLDTLTDRVLPENGSA